MKLSEQPIGPLGFLVYRFMGAMHRYDGGRTLPILQAARLTTPQLAALEFTRLPRTVSAVANHLGLSRPATSQLVDKLVSGGLLLRTDGKIDRRERNVTLSAKGKALVERIAAARIARFDASLAVLAPAVANQFELILSKVVDALGETDAPFPNSQSRSRAR